MSGLFSSPDAPPLPPPPEPIFDDTALKEAARVEAERLRKRKGFKSTILTQGLSFNEQTSGAKLLGG